MARVLIVDDDEMDRLLFEAILETSGHELYFALDGEEARLLCSNQSVDIVVTDLHMAPGHGLELIQALTESNPEVPIIAVSSTGRAQLDMAESLGARAAFEKPVDPQALIDAVEQAASGGSDH